MSRSIFMFVMLITGCCASALPSDVVKFTERREGCDHMRGEISGELDQEGQKEFEANLKESCEGTDHELSGLRVKYLKNHAVINLLSKYPTRIEAQ